MEWAAINVKQIAPALSSERRGVSKGGIFNRAARKKTAARKGAGRRV